MTVDKARDPYCEERPESVMTHMDSSWMGAAMVVHAVLLIVLVAAIVYLCLSAARYLRAKTPTARPTNSGEDR